MPVAVIKQMDVIPYPHVIGYALTEGATVQVFFCTTEQEALDLVTEYETHQTLTFNRGTPAQTTVRPENVFKFSVDSQHYRMNY